MRHMRTYRIIHQSHLFTRLKHLSITSSDALPLSYRRLVGAKAIQLGSWDNLNILHTARIGMSCVAYAHSLNNTSVSFIH